LVDTFDFPLGAPDAEEAYGGGDFGRFRSRYGLYHAGEDWRYRKRSQILGGTVSSIGHGRVTYAQPLGWGLDKGVVIVRHHFPNGDTVLSFYGHLDPKSVVLQPGDCVARGDEVGKIGKPRTSPHLHFEIRTHTSTDPGRGYSIKDPTLSGWKSPSAFIWRTRIAASPGVLWVHAPARQDTRAIGMLDQDTFLLTQDEQLTAIDLRDGSVRWRYDSPVRAYDALIHPNRSTIYVASILGIIEAFPLPDAHDAAAGGGTDAPPKPAWRIGLEGVTFPTLMPLPGGGVVVSTQRALIGLSAAGHRLWQHGIDVWSPDWVLSGDRLIVAETSGDVWTVQERKLAPWDTDTGGRLATGIPGPGAAGIGILSYDETGIHLFDPENRSVQPWYTLPGSFPGTGKIVVLPPGSMRGATTSVPSGIVLATHRDRTGESLAALTSDGVLRWRRSYPGVLREQRDLLTLDGHAYLVSRAQGMTSSAVTIYEIDVGNAELVHILSGGSRGSTTADTWVKPAGKGRLLIHIAGTGLAALDTRAAVRATQPE
jgi:murein DD-endopeptidase MepM/ murein hydrolase activator NlpD